ncbi:MAG: DUF1343 domain-containing protein [Deltaproteobacteria bacterium]|nr:MAG: DUF1343 domain-containing protein [Deltaproteobacteria bacterium]
MTKVQTGLERFLASPPRWIFGCRLGILSNPASVDSCLRHSRVLINRRIPDKLNALYAPQHGFFADKQDNMVESDDTIDPILQLPVFSLYGRTRKPTKEMFDPIDVLIIDLQDTGTRVYTFISTMSYCLEAARRFGKKVLVLDRPNPISGEMIEGNCLAPDDASFVGRFPIPMRHGLTIGELALLFNRHFKIGCDLEVIAMRHWKRSMYYQDTGLHWIPPSPNLPTPVSSLVYPGQVLWEGTNISEGRGTAQPFEIFGAPFINPQRILSEMGESELTGAALRQTAFEPTSNKWKNRLCHGLQIHITNRREFKPYITGLRLLQAVICHHQSQFEWKPPPYEYEFERLPIDLIIGNKQIRLQVAEGGNIDEIAASWKAELDEFITISREFHLY